MGRDKITRAVIYDRTSVKDDESMEEHLTRCRAHCKAQGWKVVAEHTDRGISGFHDRVRPGWVKVKEMVTREETDVVVFFALSRIERSIIRTFEFARLCEEHHVAFASVTESIDTSGAWGRVVLAVLASTAEIESLTKRERALLGRERNDREGNWSGGRLLFGFRPVEENGRKRLIVDDEAKRLLREAATDIINGASKSTVCKRWNDAGVRTTGGGRWTPSALDFTMSNPALVKHKILTASDQRRVTKAFDGRRTGQRPDRYFLSGLLTCAVCSSPMGARGGNYVCMATGPLHLSAVSSKVDNLVSRLVAEHPNKDREELRDPADEMIQRREALVAEQEALGESELSEAAIRGRDRRIQREIDAIDARLEKMQPRAPWLEMFEEYDPAGHRRFVEQVVEAVVLYPATPGANRFDPDRVQIEWRGEKPKRAPKRHRLERAR